MNTHKEKAMPKGNPVNKPKEDKTRKEWRQFVLEHVTRESPDSCWLWNRCRKNGTPRDIEVPRRNRAGKEYIRPPRLAKWANGRPKKCKPWNYGFGVVFFKSCGNKSCVNPRHLKPRKK